MLLHTLHKITLATGLTFQQGDEQDAFWDGMYQRLGRTVGKGEIQR